MAVPVFLFVDFYSMIFDGQTSQKINFVFFLINVQHDLKYKTDQNIGCKQKGPRTKPTEFGGMRTNKTTLHNKGKLHCCIYYYSP
mmetsp:Transcript_24690/g.47292  ORF Transcript_24690/g.47292 Transcript_24690/m.47292 type:complete len:85 (-) Transcript_24690:2371-2625(-)